MQNWQDKNLKIPKYKFKGDLYPFQNQGVAFLATVKNCLLMDATGLGKTVQAISAYDLLQNKYKDLQIIVITLASVQIQWQEFFEGFMPSVKVKAVIGNKEERSEFYRDFAAKKIDGIILNYAQIMRDSFCADKYAGIFPQIALSGKSSFLVILDEVQKCKTVSSKTAKAVQKLSYRASGIKALTATPVYTHLIDLYGIFKILEPQLFQTKQKFKEDFCLLDYTFSQWGQISGYKNHNILRDRIKPYTLGRTKAEVAPDLPPLIPKDIFLELPPIHKDIYDDLEDQIDLLRPDEKRAKIAAMVDCQVCANCLENVKSYLGNKESHPKLDEVVRLLEEDLVGEKIVIYSRYVQTLEKLKEKLNSLTFVGFWRISGVECIQDRDENLKAWQAHTGTAVLMITAAGGAGLNLQAAGTIIFIDRPWSPGELSQIRGRIHRIGSKYKTLLEINLIARGTIDEYVLESLRGKAENISQIFDEKDQPASFDTILKKRDEKRTLKKTN